MHHGQKDFSLFDNNSFRGISRSRDIVISGNSFQILLLSVSNTLVTIDLPLTSYQSFRAFSLHALPLSKEGI